MAARIPISIVSAIIALIIISKWSYQPYPDLQYKQCIEGINTCWPGQTITIPLNPATANEQMVLTVK